MKCFWRHLWASYRDLTDCYSEFGSVKIRFRYCLKCKKMQWKSEQID